MISSPPLPSRRRRILLWLTATAALSLATIGVCSYCVMTLSSEAAVLKAAYAENAGRGSLSTQVQLSAGPVLLSAARWIAQCTGKVDAETMEALRSVRAASVGVYTCRAEWSGDPSVRRRCDEGMLRRGWRRRVGVDDVHSTVMIYTPVKESRGKTLRVCIAVRDSEQLVIVSGKIDGSHLLPLVTRQLEQHRLAKASDCGVGGLLSAK